MYIRQVHWKHVTQCTHLRQRGVVFALRSLQRIATGAATAVLLPLLELGTAMPLPPLQAQHQLSCMP
jgi:hypothetical protein